MLIAEFFNPHSTDHIKAYIHLDDNGAWPDGFLPETIDVEFQSGWHQLMQAKMANAWVTAVEHGHVFGMPHIDQ